MMSLLQSNFPGFLGTNPLIEQVIYTNRNRRGTIYHTTHTSTADDLATQTIDNDDAKEKET